MTMRTKGYWFSTALLAADFGFAGSAALLGAPFMLQALEHLGYPSYFATILGTWKVLGAIAILVPVRARLAEWAYAGMFFDLTAAALSHLAAGDGLPAVAPVLIVLGLWLASWQLRPAARALAADGNRPRWGVAGDAPRTGSMTASASSTLVLASLCGVAVACSPSAPAPRQSSASAAREEEDARRPAPGTDAAAVVRFWREAGPGLWFAKDPAFDRRFRERFLDLHEAAARGQLDGWTGAPEGSLALLILLDQFPRNAFRNTPRMYATDELARAVADRAIRSGHDRAIENDLRVFMYLPFAHSEDLADQERSVRLCESLGEPTLGRAKHHRDIVRRFGRFPHRNPIVGRPMRPEEQKYLDEGGFAG